MMLLLTSVDVTSLKEPIDEATILNYGVTFTESHCSTISSVLPLRAANDIDRHVTQIRCHNFLSTQEAVGWDKENLSLRLFDAAVSCSNIVLHGASKQMSRNWVISR